MSAHDQDGDPLTYALIGSDSPNFSIDADTGQIRVREGTILDFERRPMYDELQVRVWDGHGGTDTIDATVETTDAGEPPPPPPSLGYQVCSP